MSITETIERIRELWNLPERVAQLEDATPPAVDISTAAINVEDVGALLVALKSLPALARRSHP